MQHLSLLTFTRGTIFPRWRVLTPDTVDLAEVARDGGTRNTHTDALISRESISSHQLMSTLSWTRRTSWNYRWDTTRKVKHRRSDRPVCDFFRGFRFRTELQQSSVILAPAKVHNNIDVLDAESDMGLSSSPRRGYQQIKSCHHLVKVFKMTFTHLSTLASSITLSFS